MNVIHTVADVRRRLATEPSIAFVPTMGNLHAGHLALVEVARRRGRCVVASIFVNPLQFEPGSDFERYPRTLARDCELLEDAGCNVLFAPDVREMYPVAQEMMVTPPKLAAQLCGDFRPGHFEGVATVVAKLFNIVRPHLAVFGKKDYQQLHVIRSLVRQLNFGIEIVGADTVREPDGLAMSSRNGYLSADERREAVRLNRTLRALAERLRGGARDFAGLEREGMEALASHGWKVDYVAVRNRDTLGPPAAAGEALVVLGAAWLGRTRLIDNIET
jgi:pantoate--beta-alanine ligase